MFLDLLTRAMATIPSQCMVCRAWPAQPVCEACVVRFAQPIPRCPTCALPAPAHRDGQPRQCGECMTSPPPLDACFAAVSYAYPWAGLIINYKLNGNPGLSAVLTTLLRSTPWVEPALERCDLVLPMPLSMQRLRERGFNQALELARHLAPRKTDATLLLRIRDTPSQRPLKRTERQRNVAGAFALEPLRAQRVRDRSVVLVDDVMTSGASLFAAARTLREAGAAHITALALARTDDPLAA
ncbi:MAG: ComF family protein [Burkholderiaceae bacterium]|nr:MAG: ComF family protein [Burkholderiaceae bacterium]